jgi:hypothetical protein
VLWGKHDLSFELSQPEAYRRDVPDAEVHVLDAGHFALDTAADEIAQLVRGFLTLREERAMSRSSRAPDEAGWRARIGVLTPDDDTMPE